MIWERKETNATMGRGDVGKWLGVEREWVQLLACLQGVEGRNSDGVGGHYRHVSIKGECCQSKGEETGEREGSMIIDVRGEEVLNCDLDTKIEEGGLGLGVKEIREKRQVREIKD